MSRLLTALAALMSLALTALPASAAGTRTVDTTAEAGSFDLVNQARAVDGLPALVSNAELVAIARQHSEAMAADVESGASCLDGVTLRHRDSLSEGITAAWRTLRENVGCGQGSYGTAAILHDGFMSSPGHRANILAGDVNQIGVGGFRDVDGGLWVTQIFMQADLVAQPMLAPTPATVHTAVRASQDVFASGAAALAVVARADDFADSLGGAALAGGDGPILFTPSPDAANPDPKLDTNTRSELDRVLGGSGTVYIMGGPAAVGPAVETELRAAGYTVKRLAGLDRYETAVRIAEEVVRREGVPDTILVAYGRNWPDAVTGGAAAARNGLPVVLTATDTVPVVTSSFLDGYRDAQKVVLGGTVVVSEAVRDRLDARRVAGPDRAATAVAVAKQLFGTTSGDLLVLNGWHADGWATAMALTARSARSAAPQILVSSYVPEATADYLLEHGGDVTFDAAVDAVTRSEVSALAA
ncbi:MAG TPA: cell wall-binding repeat-containing protein [Nitriliruptorales bacterium]